MTAPLHVLVIDDSAVVRQTLSSVLASDNMVVTVAADPLIAEDKIRRRRPDAIILDLEMPRMDGLTFLRRLMERDPIPVVVCSGHVESGSVRAMQALAEGAVEVIARPRIGIQGFLHESALQVLDAVRAAAAARPRSALSRARPPAAAVQRGRAFSVIAIGASTGGTEAIREILEVMPAGSPGIVIVQHMPPVFTAMFARRLDQLSPMLVREAKPGDVVETGVALVAPGSHHIAVRRHGSQLVIELSDGPLVARHRPSVDVLFHSVAESAGGSAAGVLLTGMGNDGAAGLLAMRHAGAATIAQDAATSVVFGMPREAITLGAAERVVPLESVAAALLGWC